MAMHGAGFNMSSTLAAVAFTRHILPAYAAQAPPKKPSVAVSETYASTTLDGLSLSQPAFLRFFFLHTSPSRARSLPRR